jgi:FixJ family two-component response regulator
MENSGKVFIVDDNVMFTQSLQWMFEAEGFSTIVFSSGKSFLEAYQSFNA